MTSHDAQRVAISAQALPLEVDACPLPRSQPPYVTLPAL
jgi:hypothetical protein